MATKLYQLPTQSGKEKVDALLGCCLHTSKTLTAISTGDLKIVIMMVSGHPSVVGGKDVFKWTVWETRRRCSKTLLAPDKFTPTDTISSRREEIASERILFSFFFFFILVKWFSCSHILYGGRVSRNGINFEIGSKYHVCNDVRTTIPVSDVLVNYWYSADPIIRCLHFFKIFYDGYKIIPNDIKPFLN